MIEGFIKLDQFLKLMQTSQSGGEAKMMIRSGLISVNGEPELRRGRKLYEGDVVAVDEQLFTVHLPPAPEAGSRGNLETRP
ncbi:RNA-binding S4 domain-containing protein [Romeria aff. gracilis LEGE 07310]|uniref:RNA-binding S4 domain-containing protein n=1 Tax=Vasconcelosia minhoensis LEGE 07310 TaxID=915328 RepID=A0A8J7ARM0_9CYAN|nr:RNA-binding S4 domain-containing protein [Romeria gracilis]MBE9079261.1 RNA-binding S4 domain-containing protein [Romeria aff. gracilis LEGE 07310]